MSPPCNCRLLLGFLIKWRATASTTCGSGLFMLTSSVPLLQEVCDASGTLACTASLFTSSGGFFSKPPVVPLDFLLLLLLLLLPLLLPPLPSVKGEPDACEIPVLPPLLFFCCCCSAFFQSHLKPLFHSYPRCNPLYAS